MPKPATFEFIFKPRNATQKLVEKLWPDSRIIFLMGPAGTGKTATAMGLALRDMQRGTPLWLARPAVECDEVLGFAPGTLAEKLEAWMMPFADVLSSMSMSKLNTIKSIETVAVGKLRGRTVTGNLIVDEAQNLTRKQLVCVLTRLGENGKIILCGDPQQSDLNGKPPIVMVQKQLAELPGISTVQFAAADQCRHGLVNDIVRILGR